MTQQAVNAGGAGDGQAGMVSICVPLYNKVHHVGAVLEGLLAQKHPYMEIVISDNGSNDGSSEVAREFARRDLRVRYYRVEHTITLNENWRLVMQLARGEFCKVQSADDPMHPEFVTAMIEPMLKDPEIDFAVCREAPSFENVRGLVDEAHWTGYFQVSGDLCRDLTLLPDSRRRAALLVERASVVNYLGNIFKVMYRRRCLPTDRWRQFTSSYPMAQSFADWDFLVRLFLNHRGCFVDRVLSEFHFDLHSPFVKLQRNSTLEVASKLQELMHVLTVLTDPSLRALREWISPAAREQLLAHLARETRKLAAKGFEMDAIARKEAEKDAGV